MLGAASGAVAGLVAITPAAGNVGIAGHRDSFFRNLQHVAVGDVIEFEGLAGSRSYRITDLSVVEPTDVSVLDATESAVMTLVTCYPFYFAGHAPQRFIVRAEAVH
jgi:sortase A